MTQDLRKTLDEMGAPYQDVVERLLRSSSLQPRKSRHWFLQAAAIFFCLGLTMLMCESARKNVRTNEYALAHSGSTADLVEIIRTQRADGGWANDFLTRQNAEVLRKSTRLDAQIAFKKAARNLRLRGCL